MDRETFKHRLVQTSERAILSAREHVFNHLPDEYRYLLFPNQSYDGHPLEADEEVFPHESLPGRKYLGPLDLEQVIDRLWRDGRVPEWINVSLEACDANWSYLQLDCCGRFTATEELLYHRGQGRQPFQVLSPNLPPHWESVEQNGKFDLYWLGRNPLNDA